MFTTTAGWDMDVERGPDWLLVRLGRTRGHQSQVRTLADVLWTVLEQHLAHRLVLELDQLRMLDDELVDELLGLHDRLAARGGTMRICGLTPECRQLLLDRQVVDRLVPYLDREEAVLGHPAPRHPR